MDTGVSRWSDKESIAGLYHCQNKAGIEPVFDRGVGVDLVIIDRTPYHMHDSYSCYNSIDMI